MAKKNATKVQKGMFYYDEDGVKYVLANKVILTYNRLIKFLKFNQAPRIERTDVHGFSHILGKEFSYDKGGKDDPDWLYFIKVEALVKGLSELTEKAVSKNSEANYLYYKNRAALMARTLVILNIVKKTDTGMIGNEGREDLEYEAFEDASGYASFKDAEDHVDMYARDDMWRMKHQLKVMKKEEEGFKLIVEQAPEDKAREKREKAHVSPERRMMDAYARIERRNRGNEKDMKIIQKAMMEIEARRELLKNDMDKMMKALVA